MSSPRSFIFMETRVNVAVIPEGETVTVRGKKEKLPDSACGAVFDWQNEFLVAFTTSRPPGSVIAHECWHLFFEILSRRENGDGHTAEEFISEIYAYSFGTLFRSITECLWRMEDEKE